MIKISRFDDIIDDGDGNILEEYHGYNLIIEDIVARIYDKEDCISILRDISNDCENELYKELEKKLWKMGYDKVLFLTRNGYDTLSNIRMKQYCPKSLHGGPKYKGGPCPKCGHRLINNDSLQCLCGWNGRTEIINNKSVHLQQSSATETNKKSAQQDDAPEPASPAG